MTRYTKTEDTSQKRFSPILIRVDRSRHKLSFDIHDILVWLTIYGIRSSQTRKVCDDTFQKQPVEVNFSLLPNSVLLTVSMEIVT